MLTRRQAKIQAGALQDGPAVFRVTKRKFTERLDEKLKKKPVKVAIAPKSLPPIPPDAPDLVAEASEIETAASAVAAPSAALPPSDAPFDYSTALSYICGQDPSFDQVVKRAGKPCKIFESEDPAEQGLDAFKALATAIIYQQLSGKAASTILGRFLTLFNDKLDPAAAERHPKWFPTPRAVRDKERQELTSAGLSGRKAEYVHALADRFLDGSISTEALLGMEDDEIAELLCSVKGVGPWTVDMFLMFDLKRPNILPVGDLGIRKGMSKHFGMKGSNGKKGSKQKAGGGIYLPTPDEMREAAKIWEPYRTIGSYYMWTITDTKTMEDE
ncbi:hypothetical protein SpCBS45565_g00517 [Spizellomyces sp. 'palustris']|nr:hypothetical protein SpCBS45565_g00517 [Spizellomyces sp. 'palustris']